MEQRPGEISPGPLLHRFFLGRGGSAVMFKLRLLCYRIVQEKKPLFQFRTMRMLRRFCSLCLQTIWNWKDGRKGCFTVKLKLVFPALLAFVLSAVPAGAEAPFHIGIMTGTVSQSEDSLRGAELMLERYGNSSEGGMITHVTTWITNPIPVSFLDSAGPGRSWPVKRRWRPGWGWPCRCCP